MSNIESRKSNSIRNMFYAIGTYIITVLLAFVERKIFVRSLSEVYLGLNGVMTNVLSILAISELGFGEAIMFSLYKPIRERDNDKITALLYLYKKTYLVISAVIVVAAIIFAPFIPNFVEKSGLPSREIYLAYTLFVLSTLASYFGAHRRSIIIAYQKRYIVSAVHCICRCLMYIAQIIFLIYSRNYYVYLITVVLAALVESLALFRIAGQKYPVVRRKDIVLIPNEEKKEIYKNIAAMAMHKIGGTLVTSTDNLLISKMVGVVEVGLYSNYILLRTTIYTVTHSIYKAIIASMGDLGNDNKEYAEKIFKRINFGSGILFGWCSICLLCLYDDFITLWLGERFLLDRFTVVLIVVSFYLTCMREPVIMTRDAFGLFWKDRWKPVAEACLNLIISIVCALRIGLPGIVIGTIVSTLLTCFWVEPYILYKYGFEKNSLQYFIHYLKYFIISLIGFVISYTLCKAVNNTNIFTFLVKCLICTIIPNVIFIILTFKTEECQYYFGLFKKKFENRRHK